MLSKDRNTPRREGDMLYLPVAANTKIYAGAFVAVDADGNAVPGSESTGIKAAGRADEFVDNTDGSAGDKHILVRRGVFKWKNSAVDPITSSDILGICYIVDDETVARTDGTGTRSEAGKVLEVDSDGVWVETK